MSAAITFLSQDLVHALGWTLLHSLWQGLIIMGITALLMLLLRNSRATVRYMVLCGSMALIVFSAVITFSLFFSSGQAAVAHENTQAAAHYPTAPNAYPAALHQSAIHWMDAYGRNVSGFMEQNSHFMVLAWFLGFMFFVLKYAGGLFYIDRLRKNGKAVSDKGWQEQVSAMAWQSGLRKPVLVHESPQITVPMTLGHLKPVILIPLGMISRIPPDQVEAILMHELAHILRRDYLINLLQSLVEALFFYHPAIWWLSRRIRIERENICDDIALSQSNDPLTYIKALTTMEELTSKTPAMATAISGSKKQLLMRVRRMVQPESRRIKGTEGLVILLTLFFFLFLFGTGANLNALKAGTSLSAVSTAIHPDAINSLTGYEPHEIPSNVNQPMESRSTLPQPAIPGPGMEGYPMTPDTTVTDDSKAEESARKQAEKARQEAMKILEQAQFQRQEAMKEYHEALQKYQEALKEIRDEEFKTQFKWVYVDSIDSITVVAPHRGPKDFFFYDGREFFGDREQEFSFQDEMPDKQEYVYRYSWPPHEDFLEDEEVDIIIKEFNDDILLDIRKDLDADKELRLRGVEKEIQKHMKEVKRDVMGAPRWHMKPERPQRPPSFFERQPGPEQIIRQELYEDGLIRHGKEYIVEMDSSSLYINGEKQSRSVYKKYKKIYEGVSGEALDATVRLIF